MHARRITRMATEMAALCLAPEKALSGARHNAARSHNIGRGPQTLNVTQKAGRVTAIDGLRVEKVCADTVQDVRRQRSGNVQTTEVSAKLKSDISVGAQ